LDLTFSLANTFKMKFLAKGYGVAAPTLLAVEPDICLGLRAHLVVTINGVPRVCVWPRRPKIYLLMGDGANGSHTANAQGLAEEVFSFQRGSATNLHL
jgi:hypothetical protein